MDTMWAGKLFERTFNCIPAHDYLRDAFVGNATQGSPSFGGKTYTVQAETLAGVMPSGAAGVNHGMFS